MSDQISVSRRRFLESTAVLGLSGSVLAKEGVKRPPYPRITSGLDYGWSFSHHDEREKAGAKWALSYYTQTGLREKIRKETDDVVDMDLGGMLAMRIGDTKDSVNLLSKPDNKFDHIRTAWIDKHENIRAEIEDYLSKFSKAGFNIEEKINLAWMLHLLDITGGLPAGTGALLAASDAGPASIDIVASGDGVALTRYPLNYPMTPDTVNTSKNGVTLEETKELPFTGWFGTWGYKGHIYAVTGIHPRQEALDEEMERPYLDAFFSELTGSDVNLELNYDLATQMHNLMGRVR